VLPPTCLHVPLSSPYGLPAPASCPPLLPPCCCCSNYLNAKAAAAQKARYREYQQEQQRRQADPFYNTPFEGIFGGSGGDSAKRSSRFGGKHPAAMSSVDIIDVEATTLDRD
jgi:hypothetical protein